MFWFKSSARRRRGLQFGLAAMLLAMIPVGVGSVWLRNYLDRRPGEWIPYSAESLARNLRDGRTVLVNFTADWDMTFLYHEKFALETPEVRQAIRSGNVVTLRADWTDTSPEITAELESLGVKHIPVVAVFPARSPHRPIVLAMPISKEQVLAALAEAAGNP